MKMCWGHVFVFLPQHFGLTESICPDLEDEYRERNREAAIGQREAKWQHKMHEYITCLLDDAQDALDAELARKSRRSCRLLAMMWLCRPQLFFDFSISFQTTPRPRS